MRKMNKFGSFIWVLSVVLYELPIFLGFQPIDNYLIDCGSSTNISVGGRIFVADSFYSDILDTHQQILAISPNNDSALFNSARIFTQTSRYTFSIRNQGRHWVRLYFFPFVHENFLMSSAKFSVSAQNFTLIKEYQSAIRDPVVKEYCLNVTSDKLVITFTPYSNSFAFLNALEVVSVPDELLPLEASGIGPQGSKQTIQEHTLETVARVNMGNVTLGREMDKLSRLWVTDGTYLIQNNLGTFVSNVEAVNFTGGITDIIAPSHVYGTATTLNDDLDPRAIANLTWRFDVDPGFLYLVRLHFCDIVNKSPQIFNVYVNSLFASHIDLPNLTSNISGAPYFKDVITTISKTRMLNISVGNSAIVDGPNTILNGLEIMKINNSKGSLDALDSVSSKKSKLKVGVAVGSAVGLLAVVVFGFVVVIVIVIRSRRRKVGHVGHSTTGEAFTETGGDPNGSTMFSRSKIGYRFSFSVIQEATDNFAEKSVIGVGGFGKVYKGVLRDETVVAVKRGTPQSQQGFAEFQTEIEMLSQFRHRHLVSLIGYCNEQDEMIIIYEYMENGALKNHLYGSNQVALSWKERLEICIGSARGLHYLHTGSAKAIIHRDIKTANILLDNNFMAKVADFGISKKGPEIDQTHVSTAVKGSFGYLDPEYLTRQQLTEKSDVYSFGVVMFEIVCGRPVIDPSLPKDKVNLVEWVIKCMKKSQLEEIIDPTLVTQVKHESLRKFWDIAEKCLAESGIDRPTMGDVLWNLESALQLQGDEEKSKLNGDGSLHRMASNTTSTTDFSMASAMDIVGVSMSKVFAQMVREEDMR